MIRKTIKQMLQHGEENQSVRICGWVRSKRVSKNFAFVVINDGSQQSDLQVVVDAGTQPFEVLSIVGTGAALVVEGVLKESPGKGQKWEVLAGKMECVGHADPETYPLQKKGHSLEFLREIAHLRPRTNTFGAVFRVRNAMAQLVHQFFQERGFFWIHTPILTSNDCEGAGELFQVTTLDLNNIPRNDQNKPDFKLDFFGKAAHLTVSGQLEGEVFAQSMSQIYTFGPTFRAENSNTSRHLSEFWMIEPEIAFAELTDDMCLAEDFLRYIFSGIIAKCPEELEFFEKHYKSMRVDDLAALSQATFTRMSYSDAIQELESAKQKFEFPISWGVDLQSEHERYLTDHVCKGPVTVYDYPKDIKAFYMRLNDDGRTVAAMDVLVPRIGEIIGGSQREERLDLLKARMNELKVPVEGMEWYLDLRRFGSTPHAGFGAGFERLIQYVTGMANIRDVIPFPRVPGWIEF